MNQQPKREGFVDDQAPPGPMKDVTPDKSAEPKKTRTMPPPEMEEPPIDKIDPWEDAWPMVVKLVNKKIRNNAGDTIDTLTLREPRAGDINRYGNPVRFNQQGDIVWDERKMMYIIGALSGVLVPFLEEMHPRDWNTVALRLQSFFLPDPRGL